jgi:hypothetical protein
VTGDRRPSPASSFEVAGEALDDGPSHGEQAQVVLGAPGDELAQVQGVGVASQAPAAGEERRQGIPLGIREHRVDDSDFVVGVLVMSHLQVRRRPGGQSRLAPAVC